MEEPTPSMPESTSDSHWGGAVPVIPRWRRIMSHVLNIYGLIFAQAAVIFIVGSIDALFSFSRSGFHAKFQIICIIVLTGLCVLCFKGARRLVDSDASRPLFHFSLRTMMFLVTLMCIALGAWCVIR